MTAEEAKQALKEGKKVRVKGWDKDFYLTEKIKIVDNHDNVYSDKTFEKGFSNDDWEILE